jgi:hypothetical protein
VFLELRQRASRLQCNLQAAAAERTDSSSLQGCMCRKVAHVMDIYKRDGQVDETGMYPGDCNELSSSYASKSKRGLLY